MRNKRKREEKSAASRLIEMPLALSSLAWMALWIGPGNFQKEKEKEKRRKEKKTRPAALGRSQRVEPNRNKEDKSMGELAMCQNTMNR